jgi:hypothetical protein
MIAFNLLVINAILKISITSFAGEGVFENVPGASY